FLVVRRPDVVRPRAESLHRCTHPCRIRHCLEPSFQISFSLDRLWEKTTQRCVGRCRRQGETGGGDKSRDQETAHQFFSDISAFADRKKKDALFKGATKRDAEINS